MAMCDNISRKLKEIKEARGVSVTEFSEQLEISRSSLLALLNCKGNPRTNTIEHIAQKLQIDPIVLLAEPAAVQKEERLQEVTDQLLAKIIEMIGEEDE